MNSLMVSVGTVALMFCMLMRLGAAVLQQRLEVESSSCQDSLFSNWYCFGWQLLGYSLVSPFCQRIVSLLLGGVALKGPFNQL
eukprot:4491290-Amphidinium_carterae.2